MKSTNKAIHISVPPSRPAKAAMIALISSNHHEIDFLSILTFFE